MAKKLMAFLLVVIMAFSVAACGNGGADPASTASSAAAASGSSSAAGLENASGDYSDYKVALLLPGTINDNGWNAGGYSGLKHLEEKFGIETAYSESVAHSDYEEFLRNYALQGYNIIIAHSTSFVDSVKNVAPDFPEVYFFTTNAGDDYTQAPNVAAFGAVDSGFLAGMAAACLSESGVVGVLGGEQSPSITPIVNRFVDGAKFVDPEIEVLNGFIGSLVDADKAKEMALNYISKGADYVCVSADSAGLGVLQAAAESNTYAIGFNSDQYNVEPEAVVVSVVRDFPTMYENSFLEVVNGTFEPKSYAYGIAEGGTILTDWHGWDEKIEKEKVDKLVSLLEDIRSGKINIE